MPMSVIVDVLMLTQVLVVHVCTFDSSVNKPLLLTMSIISLYHLTAIAWERYMAVKCWKDYRNKVTRRLLQKLGAIAWLLPLLKLVPTVAMIIVGVDRTVLRWWLALRSILVMASLFAIVYFYIMVFLGLRKRKQNQTSQVTIMMKVKLECKVAKLDFWFRLFPRSSLPHWVPLLPHFAWTLLSDCQRHLCSLTLY